jgi:hypothetical protein
MPPAAGEPPGAMFPLTAWLLEPASINFGIETIEILPRRQVTSLHAGQSPPVIQFLRR